jgi:RNA polymerase sigma-B factor
MLENLFRLSSERRSIASMAVELPPSAERSQLIEQYLPLVNSVARRFSGRGERQEDLAQVAALALVQAVDRRDPERSAVLPAYVSRCVEGAVLRHLRDRSSAVRVPRALHAVAAREALAGPSFVTLSTARRPVELYVDVDVANGDPARLDETAATRGLAAEAIAALGPRERQIVLMRFFLDFTQAEMAESLGISQAHVSRLLDQALAKMRRRLERASRLSGSEGRATLDRGDGTRAAAAPRG